MQQAIDAPYWAKDGPRNHKNAEVAALRLLESWRAAQRPIYHVRHDSVEANSAYRPGQPGNAFKPGFEPRDGEASIAKNTGSAFSGTQLESELRARQIDDLVVAGVITNNSVETTVRHGATLGFNITLAEDACFTFARRDFDGRLRSAEEVQAMSLANLDGEYCRVARSAEILAVTGSPQPILPYFDLPAGCLDADPRAADVAAYIGSLVESARVEHIGSTAVENCPGKGVIDLLVTYPDGSLESTKSALTLLGFQPQPGRDPFPEERPMRVGAIFHLGTLWRIHAHVVAATDAETQTLRNFRDRLRADPALLAAYANEKRRILAVGVIDTLEYCHAKSAFVEGANASGLSGF